MPPMYKHLSEGDQPAPLENVGRLQSGFETLAAIDYGQLRSAGGGGKAEAAHPHVMFLGPCSLAHSTLHSIGRPEGSLRCLQCQRMSHEKGRELRIATLRQH